MLFDGYPLRHWIKKFDCYLFFYLPSFLFFYLFFLMSTKRQSSHSIIEKRRRERINDKIQQLKDIVPSCNPYSEQQPIVGPSFHQPLHKLAILEAAIAYIEQLHQILLDAPSSPLLNDPKIVNILEHARQCQKN
ncbi:helix-loop-helix DNA-binding domain-containing protein [Fennellomyces sp. T-0311]|nr:helix-loop-helix DNA-binding domain-containing protein [Fennellomyces sp. T-0311]